jgi:flavin-dependent dehydrogenase
MIELGVVPGGYAWAFPKGDHVNIGVGGWATEAPRLRSHLERLCSEHGIDPARVDDRRGYRLPYRTRDTVLARGRTLAVGDAAGLVDPVSGDGIYEAAVSARLAARAVVHALSGRAAALGEYAAAVDHELRRLASASWLAKHSLDRFPRATYEVVRSRLLWPAVEELLEGRTTDPWQTSLRSRLPLAALNVLGRTATPRS